MLQRYFTPALTKGTEFAIAGVFLIAAMVLAWNTGSESSGDFGNYYYGARFLSEDRFDENIYDPWSFNRMVENEYALRGESSAGLFLNHTPVPPITALLYIPLQWCAIGLAKSIWNALTAFLLVASLVRLFRHLHLDLRWLMLLALVCFAPLRSNWMQGQGYALIAAFMIEGYLAYSKGRWHASALLWSIAIALKITPAIVLLFLVSERNFRHAARVLIWLILICSASMIWIDPDLWWTCVREILPRLMRGEINDPFAPSYQSLTVLLRQTLVFDAILNPTPLLHAPWLAAAVDACFKVLVPGFTWLYVRTADDPFRRWTLWMFVSLLVSGYGTSYGLLLCLPMALMLCQTGTAMTRMSLLLLLLTCNLPVHWFASWPGALAFPRLWLLLALFVAVAVQPVTQQLRSNARFQLHAKTLLILALTGGVASGFLTTWKHEHRPPSELVAYANAPLLATGYGLRDGRLEVAGWASDTATTDERHGEWKTPPFDEAWKKQCAPWMDDRSCRTKQPIIADGRWLYYLSDEGRGVGFYALRKADLSHGTE